MENKLIDPVMLKALQAFKEREALEKTYQAIKEQETLIKSAFFGLDLAQIREIIQWQETFSKYEEIEEINELVDNLAGENLDLDKADEWLESNRDELTCEKLSMIVYAAMRLGVADYMRKRAELRHSDNRAKDAQIPVLWKEFKAKGMSKNNAASRIAQITGLKTSTVREKLKGL